MQIAQRCILIIGFGIILCFFSAFFFRDKADALSKEWELVQTDRFLNKLCRTGQCSQEEYIFFFNALRSCGNEIEIQIEEYRAEQDLEQNRYYAVFSWEEIKSSLWTEGSYDFSENSIILVEVLQSGRVMKNKNRRFGRVIKRYENDT